MRLQEAFEQVCAEAKPREVWFVSLYVEEPFYGGPEEGGWWGNDTVLVASQEVNDEKEAEHLRDQVTAMAKGLTADARKVYGERCIRETDWLEARGLDDSFLPETEGPEEYRVVVERRRGENEKRGNRHYE